MVFFSTIYTSYVVKLFTCQNKVVRHIGGSSYREHSNSFYSNLKILKLPDLLKLETAQLVFRYLQNNLPPLISSLFNETNSILVRHTRSSNPSNLLHLYTPKYHSASLQRCIRYQGMKIWNSILHTLTTKPSIFSNAMIKITFKPMLRHKIHCSLSF